LGAGRHIKYEGVDETHLVNIQDNFLTFTIPKLLTLEGLTLTLTCVIFYQVFNPVSVITNVKDWKEAITYIAMSIVRDKVGTHTLGDILQNTQIYQEAIMVIALCFIIICIIELIKPLIFNCF
jgi:regulator of protease activity HflC (stomatin/prohibitin superfamily)